MVDSGAESPTPNNIPIVSYPINVIYCGECSIPIEYCEYSGKYDKCQAWLERNLPQMVDKQLTVEAPPTDEGATATAEDGVDKKHQKRGGKGTSKSGGKATKTVVPRVQLKTEVRSKNKAATVVKGLGTCGIDLKTASKFFANRFACGCSVVAGANDELVIQGDFKDELFDVIPEKWGVDEDAIEDLGGEQKK